MARDLPNGGRRDRGPQLEIPGEVQLAVAHHAGPLAQPVSLQLQNGGAVQIHTFGGISQRLAVASEQFAATLAAGHIDVSERTLDADLAARARLAFRIADALLAAEPATMKPPAAEPGAEPAPLIN